MAYSEDMAEIMRSDLGMEPGLTEKKMFGGLCFCSTATWSAA